MTKKELTTATKSELTASLEEYEVTFGEWTTHSGEVRYYPNTPSFTDRETFAFLLQGVAVSFYQTGNVASASKWSVREQEWKHLSNTSASKYHSGSRVWLDSNGEPRMGAAKPPRDVVRFLEEKRDCWLQERFESQGSNFDAEEMLTAVLTKRSIDCEGLPLEVKIALMRL